MKLEIMQIVQIVTILYPLGLREALVKMIDNPDSEVDEKLVAALDAFFGYKP